MKQVLFSALLMTACAVALAKLPAAVLDDAAKAKAAEAAARTAWTGKTEAYLLCKSQDKVSAYYRKTAGGTATAVAGPPTPCADPGPFAYTPPEQKPLEAAGAHSPPGNATSPPSTTTPAAAMAPAKKS